MLHLVVCAGFNGATGELNITNGGSLTTTMLNHIGQTDVAGAGKGIVNISGAGSIWLLRAVAVACGRLASSRKRVALGAARRACCCIRAKRFASSAVELGRATDLPLCSRVV